MVRMFQLYAIGYRPYARYAAVTFDTPRYPKVCSLVGCSGCPEPVREKNSPKTLGKLGSAQRSRVGTARAYETEQEVKNLKKKGGESNEKERITSMQPAPVLDAVLGRTIRRGRRDDLQWFLPTPPHIVISSSRRCAKTLCHGSNRFLIRCRATSSTSTGPVIMTRRG